MGTISKIFLSRVRKEERVEIDEGFLLENYGLEGDSHSEKGSNKQVTLFFDKGRAAVSSEPLEGLCFNRFMETLRIGGIDPETLEAGVEVEVGDALLSVSSSGKKCYPECLIILDGRKCSLSSDVRFCRVLRSGVIRKGSTVKVVGN